jgi:hypothetical protein
MTGSGSHNDRGSLSFIVWLYTSLLRHQAPVTQGVYVFIGYLLVRFGRYRVYLF